MKITRAMYMISSNKLQKARQSQAATEPYFHGLRDELEKLMEHFPEIEHIYFDNRPKDNQETIKRQGFVVVTGDKGLAGAYNHNVLKKAEELYRASDDPHLFVIGQVGYHYFSARDIAMDKEFHYTAYIAIIAYYWFVWAMYRESCGANMGEALTNWHHMAVKYADYALNFDCDF